MKYPLIALALLLQPYLMQATDVKKPIEALESACGSVNNSDNWAGKVDTDLVRSACRATAIDKRLLSILNSKKITFKSGTSSEDLTKLFCTQLCTMSKISQNNKKFETSCGNGCSIEFTGLIQDAFKEIGIDLQ